LRCRHRNRLYSSRAGSRALRCGRLGASVSPGARSAAARGEQLCSWGERSLAIAPASRRRDGGGRLPGVSRPRRSARRACVGRRRVGWRAISRRTSRSGDRLRSSDCGRTGARVPRGRRFDCDLAIPSPSPSPREGKDVLGAQETSRERAPDAVWRRAACVDGRGHAETIANKQANCAVFLIIIIDSFALNSATRSRKRTRNEQIATSGSRVEHDARLLWRRSTLR